MCTRAPPYCLRCAGYSVSRSNDLQACALRPPPSTIRSLSGYPAARTRPHLKNQYGVNAPIFSSIARLRRLLRVFDARLARA
ncbi:hypothetical protein B0H12DRAFT_218926 [Mycena haematopus]|nr:hypothetical protein B0H12DRAFT_218926 [Mycena haematopus]